MMDVTKAMCALVTAVDPAKAPTKKRAASRTHTFFHPNARPYKMLPVTFSTRPMASAADGMWMAAVALLL